LIQNKEIENFQSLNNLFDENSIEEALKDTYLSKSIGTDAFFGKFSENKIFRSKFVK
jgi:hypothetical protein